MENSILPCVVELSLLLCEGGAATRLIISRWDLYSTCWGSWNNIWSWNMKTEWAAVCFKYSAELLESVLDHYVRGDWNHLHIRYAKIKSLTSLTEYSLAFVHKRIFILTRSSFMLLDQHKLKSELWLYGFKDQYTGIDLIRNYADVP